MIGAFAVIITTLTVLSLPAALLDRDRRIIAVAAVYATVMCLLGTAVSGELAGAMLLAYFPLLTIATVQAARRRARRKAQHARAVAEGWA